MRGDRVVGRAKLPANVGLAYSPCFPSAIQMFEPLSGESRLGLITENKVALCHRCVSLEVPRLADLEVSAELSSPWRYVNVTTGKGEEASLPRNIGNLSTK